MIELNYLAIVVAALATFMFAAVYYAAFASQVPAPGAGSAQATRPAAMSMGIELVRALAVASVVAGLVVLLGVSDAAGAAGLALALWIAFPVVLLIGSVAHEGVRVKVAALHSGDWLAKLLIIAVITSLWR